MYKRLGAYYMRHIARRDVSLPSLINILIKGVVDSALGTFFARVLTMVAGIVIARHLGVLLYGEYVTLMATLALMAGLLGMGMDTWLLREGGRNPTTLLRNAQQVLILKFGGAFVLLLLLTLASSRATLSWPLLLGVVGVIFDSFAQTGYAVLRATQRNRHVAVFQTLSALLLLLALWAMYGSSPSVLLLMIVQAACSVLIAAFIAVNVWRIWNTVEGSFDLLAVVKGAWLFVLADILSNIYTQSNVAILGSTVGPAAAGAFRPALNTISATFILPLLVFYVGLPMLSAPDLTRQSRRSLISVMALGSALYGLLVMFGIWVAGETFIHLVYGRQFDAALPFLMIMSVVPLVKAGSFVCVAVMLAQNSQGLRVLLQSIVVVVSVVGGLTLLPVYGAFGAAWLYVAVEVLLFALYFLGAVRSLRRVQA